jgi:hypothetical protein
VTGGWTRRRAGPLFLAIAAAAAGARGPAALASQSAAQPQPPARVAAGRTTGRIVVDGRLDEPDWQAAGVVPDLVQRMPHPGAPTAYHTEVRILADGENLYFGLRCFDPDPSTLGTHTMQRDVADPFGDDFVDVVLDTYGDRRTGYLFEVYPTGAVADGLISGAGVFSLDWDGLWEARSSIGPDGWTAEIRIPSGTLHFKPGLGEWGLNFNRFVARDRTVLVWCCASLDSDILDLSHAGVLTGVDHLTQGIGLGVSPYALSRLDRPIGSGDQDVLGRAGLDLTYSLSSGLASVLTINTDFAETEVDARQINLTRFPLFFPEKRPFFLEGSNQFAFASGLGTDFIPFYSRRVGLLALDDTGENNAVIPIDGGLKILGHAGRFSLAALDIETGTSPFAPRTNQFAGRLAWDATDRLRLGTILTRGSPDGVSDNSLAGADLVWHTSALRGSKNLTLTGWGARSDGDVPEGRRSGWGAGVYYPNDLWNGYLAFNEFGDGLDPGLGFLPRPGTRQYQAGQAFQPRPARDGPFSWARQFFYETFYTQVDDLEGRTESRRLFTAPFNVETDSGEHFEANWAPQLERLTEPFEVAPGVVVPPGSYHFTRYRAEAQSAESRPWRVGATVWMGDFYDGRLTQAGTFLQWNLLRGHLQQRLDLEDDYGRMPEGDFIRRLWQLQNVIAVSPRLLVFSFFQYDTDSQSFGMNTRLRWTFRPGNDLYVVWNRNWAHPLDAPAFGIAPTSDQVTVKVRFDWRG